MWKKVVEIGFQFGLWKGADKIEEALKEDPAQVARRKIEEDRVLDLQHEVKKEGFRRSELQDQRAAADLQNQPTGPGPSEAANTDGRGRSELEGWARDRDARNARADSLDEGHNPRRGLDSWNERGTGGVDLD